jgi:hypothetical protein
LKAAKEDQTRPDRATQEYEVPTVLSDTAHQERQGRARRSVDIAASWHVNRLLSARPQHPRYVTSSTEGAMLAKVSPGLCHHVYITVFD